MKIEQHEVVRNPLGREQLVALAREAGCYQERDDDGTRFMALPESSWGKFAALVAEATKEKAAKVCKDYAEKCVEAENWEAEDVALHLDAAIRSMK